MDRSERRKQPSAGHLDPTGVLPAHPDGPPPPGRENKTPDRSSSNTSLRAIDAASSAKGSSSTPVRRSKESLHGIVTAGKAATPPPNKDDMLLQLLRKEFESIRQNTTCKICFDILYEPYTTACGHTYCYNCLCKSFASSKSTTCPECRTLLKEAPAPAYVLRDLTHSYSKHQQLLPPGETLEEHADRKKKQADEIQKDKNNKHPKNGGLFKGAFETRRIKLRPIRDAEDGVDRCPYCTWELEGGMCVNCGLPFDENGNGEWGGGFAWGSAFSDVDLDSEYLSGDDMNADMELDDPLAYITRLERHPELQEWYDDEAEDFDDEDDEDYQFTMDRYLGPAQGAGPGRRRPTAAHSAAGSRRRSYASSLPSDMQDSQMDPLEEVNEDDEDGDEDEDGDSSMRDFINDEENSDFQSGTSSAEATPQPEARRIRRSESAATASSNRLAVGEIDDEDDAEDGPVLPGRRRFASQTPNDTATSRESSANTTIDLTQIPSVSEEDDDDDEDDEGPVAHGRARFASQNSATSRSTRLTSIGASSNGNATNSINSSEVEDSSEDEDSDGTTVGSALPSNSAHRTPNIGSLTPSTDSSQLSADINSQQGASRISDQSNVHSNQVLSPNHYEDNDADDEDITQSQGFSPVRRRPRSRASVTRFRNFAQQGMPLTLGNGLTNSQPLEFNSDDTDGSGETVQAEQQGQRPQEVNDDIRYLYAQHRTWADSDPMGIFDGGPAELRLHAGTPRSSIRNRMPAVTSATLPTTGRANNITSPVATSRGLGAPGRMRTPLAEGRNNSGIHNRPTLERVNSGSNRAAAREANLAALSTTANGVTSGPNHVVSPINRSRTNTPLNISAASNMLTSFGLATERPASRIDYRTAAAQRRGSGAGLAQQYPTTITPGLGGARNNNPFRNPNGPTMGLRSVRPRPSFIRAMEGITSYDGASVQQRPSRRELREQSSTATLRAYDSRQSNRAQVPPAAAREAATQTRPSLQPQASRIQLLPQQASPSPQRQPSLRSIRHNLGLDHANASSRSANMDERMATLIQAQARSQQANRRAAELENQGSNDLRSRGFEPVWRSSMQGNPAAAYRNPVTAATTRTAATNTTARGSDIRNASNTQQHSGATSAAGRAPPDQRHPSTVRLRRSHRNMIGANTAADTTPPVRQENPFLTNGTRARAIPSGTITPQQNVPTVMARGITSLTTGGDRTQT